MGEKPIIMTVRDADGKEISLSDPYSYISIEFKINGKREEKRGNAEGFFKLLYPQILVTDLSLVEITNP